MRQEQLRRGRVQNPLTACLFRTNSDPNPPGSNATSLRFDCARVSVWGRFDRAPYRVDDAGKFDEEPIAGGLNAKARNFDCYLGNLSSPADCRSALSGGDAAF
jgi:hypothetical protein